MTAVGLADVGLMAPGLTGWQASRPILSGDMPYQDEPLPAPRTALLPASERRRATGLVRLALAAAEDAMRARRETSTPSVLASVFASSGGDLDIVDRICRALREIDHPVSPTHFHNSVHNAPSGYWAIATGSHGGSQSIAGFDASFAVGLLEAAALVCADRSTVLLVAYDQAAPPPFAQQRAIGRPFAVGLVLTPIDAHVGHGLARLDLCLGNADDNAAAGPPMLGDAGLERLRLANPAARALPLLRAIARGEAATVVLPYLARRSLTVRVGL